MTIKIRPGMLALVAILAAEPVFGQTNLNFNNVTATSEGAIRLSWNSTTNEVYEIDYADALNTNADGTTAWLPLYTDYPSHGTNTFIADAGNYDLSPEILHPKLSPMRFYRVALIETNTSATNPTVSIISPTNGASLSGDVTIQVAASSSEILSEVKLYVDGEEQWSDGDGTNFLVNTCEWPNGTHTLFATAKSQSSYEGVPNGGIITYGRAVSSYKSVTFDNLITRFDFSQPFFEPDLGQTQAVTATFAANVNWTLEIQNDSSNDVRYVTGSGSSMEFDWDGTGSNNAALPDGVYSYLLTVQTNGLPLTAGGGGGGGGSPPAPSFASASFSAPADSAQWLAAPADGLGAVVPFALYPPGFDTNNLVIFAGSLADYLPQRPLLTQTASFSAMDSGGSPSPNIYGGSSQSTRGPKRKHKVGSKGVAGTFGVLYRTYGTNGFSSQHPLSGLPFPLRTRVGIDGQATTAQTVDYRILVFQKIAADFAAGMKKAAWKSKFVKPDSKWDAIDIKKSSIGGRQIFDTCNFGILMTHGSFANVGQTEADGILYTYAWLGPNNYVRLSDMQFGDSSGTNGLKWMTLFGCNMLRPANITSMANNSKLPLGDNLHLLLGSATTNYAASSMGQFYASNLVAKVTIENSWYNCALQSFAQNSGGMSNTVTYRVMGQANCFSDTIYTSQDPDINTAFQIKFKDVFTFSP